MKNITSNLRLFALCVMMANGGFSPLSIAATSPISQPWQSITPGAGGWFEAVGIGPGGLIVVASDLSGAYLSTDNGTNWTAVGAPQGILSTHVSSVGFHKTDPKIVLLGTDDGIYRSINQGKNFTLVQADRYITSIQFAPSNSATLYATGHSAYNAASPILYVSSNSGASWTQQTSSGLDNARIQKLIVHPKRPNELYAVSSPDRFTELALRAVYRSTDSGQTWSAIGTTLGDAFDFAISSSNPNDMYLSSTTGVHYSADGGNTWSNTGQVLEFDYFGNNIGYSLWLDPKNGNTIRLISNALSVWENTRWGIWNGTKKGSAFSWKFLNTAQTSIWSKSGWDMPDFWHFNPIKNNDLWSGFYYSGESLRTIAIDPRNASRMLFVNAQWIFNTSDGGVKFSQVFTKASGTGWRSRGLENVNTYDVAASRWKNGKNVIFGGYADMGCWRSLDNGLSWESCNPVQYASSNPVLATPSIRGNQQGLSHRPDPGRSQNTALLLTHLLYHGWLNLNLYRVPFEADVASNGGWRGTGGNATAFAIDHARTGMVWAAMGDNIDTQMTLLRSTQSGKFDSWQYASNGIAADDLKHIYGISIDPNSPTTQRTLFLTANGEVYRSTDDGLNWTKVLSCRDRTSNQNYCVTTAVDYFNSKLVYAAGSAGLFVSKDGGDTWEWADNTHMTKPESLAGTFYAYLDRYLISRVATDPFTPNRVYMAVLDTRSNADNRGGIWMSDSGYNWQRLYANPYMRSVAVSPYLKNELVATSSMAYTSGSYDPQSLGILRQNANGKWEQLNKGLSYNNVSTIGYSIQSGRYVLGSMGPGQPHIN
jgi:photosystem II stability/assembly factor-like uncharacterized protein